MTFRAACMCIRVMFLYLSMFNSQKCTICHIIIFVLEWNIYTNLQRYIPENFEIFWYALLGNFQIFSAEFSDFWISEIVGKLTSLNSIVAIHGVEITVSNMVT